MHSSTFDYLKPTDEQTAMMGDCRAKAKEYADFLEATLPNGPDKSYCFRILRTCAMWVNVAITRQPDGAPRE